RKPQENFVCFARGNSSGGHLRDESISDGQMIPIIRVRYWDFANRHWPGNCCSLFPSWHPGNSKWFEANGNRNLRRLAIRLSYFAMGRSSVERFQVHGNSLSD